MRRVSILLTALMLLVIAPSVLAAKPGKAGKGGKLKPKDLLLQRGWPDVSDADRSLTELEFAKGAPAAMLLKYREHDWEAGLETQRVRVFHRTKILTEDGIEDHGTETWTVFGRLAKVEARTILADGTVINAKDGINQTESDSGARIVQIAYPQVQVGAILDLDIQVNQTAWGVQPWTLQGSLPIQEARLVIRPPIGLRFRTAVMNLPPESNRPDASFNIAGGNKAHAWLRRDIPAIPAESFLPPTDDISQTLFLILESYKDAFNFIPIGKDWPSWNERWNKSFEEWFKMKHSSVVSLAKSVTEGMESPVEKAEAIRVALKDRFRVVYYEFTGVPEKSPDQILAEGSGDSTELAGLATIMLRAVGVDSHLAVIRRRSDGILPVEFPITALMNGVLVRFKDGEQMSFFSPASNIHASKLPMNSSGVVAMPIDGVSDKPIPVPDFTAAENKSERSVRGTLQADGTLAATSEQRYSGVAAERWRRALRNDSEEEQRQLVQRTLQSFSPSVAVESVAIENLEDATQDLVVRSTWEAPGFASKAGNRLIFNPNLFARADASDWTADTRQHQVDLKQPYETIDTLLLTLPDSQAGLTVPDSVKFPAGPVGLYQTQYGKQGEDLLIRRHMRLDMFRFPSKIYPQLKRWFIDIAEVDEKPIVVELN